MHNDLRYFGDTHKPSVIVLGYELCDNSGIFIRTVYLERA